MFFFAAPQQAKELAEEGKLVVDVSSRSPLPWSYLSPFYPHGGIPVPGMHATSDSVEGIWQGLKVIGGKTDPSYFKGKGRKRRGQPECHLHGKRSLNYVFARKLIYQSSYWWMVYRCPRARWTALALLLIGLDADIYLHDVETNGDIENTKAPWAHAALLAKILNENLETIRKYRSDAEFRKQYDENGDEPYYVLANLIIREKQPL